MHDPGRGDKAESISGCQRRSGGSGTAAETTEVGAVYIGHGSVVARVLDLGASDRKPIGGLRLSVDDEPREFVFEM